MKRLNNGRKIILKLQLTAADKILEIVGWISIIVIWLLIFKNYNKVLL